jgi:hypothetical protein
MTTLAVGQVGLGDRSMNVSGKEGAVHRVRYAANRCVGICIRTAIPDQGQADKE